jgi:MFS family permease
LKAITHYASRNTEIPNVNALRHFAHDLASLPRDLKLLALSVFLWGAGDSLFVYIVPLYLEDLGAAPAQIGLIYGLAASMIALTTIPAGILADRWGRKQVMLLSWSACLSAVVLMAAADGLFWFSAGWVGYWLASFALPAMSSYVADGRGRLSTERALTTVYAAFALGTVFSPALGGWLGATFGVRLLFILGAVLTAASTAVLALVRRQPVAPAAEGAGFRGLLANRRFLGFCALVAGTWFVMWLGMPLAANFLSDVRGLSLAQIGLLGSFDALGATLSGLALGRQPPRRGFLMAQVLTGIYLALLLLAASFGWIVVAFLARSSAFVARTLAEAMATRVVPRAQWGRAFGVIETAATAGTVLAPLSAGWLYEVRPALPFQASLVLLPLAIVAAYLYLPRTGTATPETELPLHPAEAPAIEASAAGGAE